MKKVHTFASDAASLYWHTQGQGPDLVLIHGWGMNGAVWQPTIDILSQHFTVHVVDLPGFGHSALRHASSLEEMASQVLEQAPPHAIWLGWSLGGLVASHIAIHQPQRVVKLITVASSPKFAAEKPWRGIQPQVLTNFTQQLMEDFRLTIERFMALQAMGSPSARQDVKQIKQAVLSRPEPNPQTLLSGLTMLAEVDLRQQLVSIQAPVLRLYGRLDGLVPVKVASDMDTWLPKSESHIFQSSSHAPFITETEAFCQKVVAFSGQ
ncbi:pimeloyl-ACP methyl ester esterase BioH [Vibrio sp. AK197]